MASKDSSEAVAMFVALILLFAALVVVFGNKKRNFKPIADKYKTVEEVSAALRRAGLEVTQLIIGVDLTKSNELNKNETFDGFSLHALRPGKRNPYQEVIEIVGRTLAPFDADRAIPLYGFGDSVSRHTGLRKLTGAARGFNEAVQAYDDTARQIERGTIELSGPTSFGPLIDEAIKIVKKEKEHHTLVIITDGEVNRVKETVDAIVRASEYPLSIICVGVGDGPWDLMEEFDDKIPARKFDNFQFVDFSSVSHAKFRDSAFATAALQELPDQYKYCKRHLM